MPSVPETKENIKTILNQAYTIGFFLKCDIEIIFSDGETEVIIPYNSDKKFVEKTCEEIELLFRQTK